MADEDRNGVVTMICPNLRCGKTVAAPASARGKVVRCVFCNRPFRVPSGGGGAQAPQPEGQQTS